MLNENFVIIGTLIISVGSIAYISDTLKGNVKPNRVSFLLWSIVPFIAFAAMLKEGVGMSALMTFSTGFFPLLIFIASFLNKNAEWKLTRFDLICGALSLIGLVLWIITKVGIIAIIFSILADGLAAIPTLRKAFYYPETEIAWPWFATAVGVVLTLLTLESWTFVNYGFLLYIFIVNMLITIFTYFKIGKIGINHKL